MATKRRPPHGSQDHCGKERPQQQRSHFAYLVEERDHERRAEEQGRSGPENQRD